jgi:hypothetical protein
MMIMMMMMMVVVTVTLLRTLDQVVGMMENLATMFRGYETGSETLILKQGQACSVSCG